MVIRMMGGNMKTKKYLFGLGILILLICIPFISAYSITISNYDYLTETPISSTIEVYKDFNLFDSATGIAPTLNLPSGVYSIYAVKDNYKTKTIQESYLVDHNVTATNYQAKYNTISVNSVSPSSGNSNDNVIINLGHSITAQTNTGPSWKESDYVSAVIKATMNGQTKSVNKSLNVGEGDVTNSAISFIPQNDFGVVNGTYPLNIEIEIEADAWTSTASRTIDFATICAPTNGGVEICDGFDNDCDGLIDEGFSLICGWTPENSTLSIPGTASQIFNLYISNPYNNSVEIKWYANSSLVQTGGTSYSFIANLGLIGTHTIKAIANNTETNESSSKEWQLNVTQADWVTFWGRVIDSEIGLPLAGKSLSFYQDTEIESKYSDVNQLEAYMYETWQALAPKAIPDAVTDAAGYFYVALADGIWNYVIKGSREDEMEVNINSSVGAKKRDSELNENCVSTNFNAEGHILYQGKYEKRDENDATNGNKYTCGQSVRFVMFGVNNGGTDETITFAVQDHTSNGGPNAPIIYTGNISEPSQSLTTLAGNKSEKYFDWGISCPKTAGRYDIHIIWDDEVWHKIGNFFVIPDDTPPQINIWGPSTVFRNEPLTVGYWSGDPPQPGSMPDLVMQIQSISNIPDTSIQIEVNKDVIGNPGAVDMESYGGNQEINLTYNESGNFTTRLTAIDASGNEAYKEFNVTVWITEDDADSIALPLYTQFGIGGAPWYKTDFTTQLNASSPDVYSEFDRYNDAAQVGDEYLAPGNNLTQTEIDGLNAVINGCSGPEYMKPILPSTAVQYNQTLYDFLVSMDVTCNAI